MTSILIRVFKNWNVDSAKGQWSNNYEIENYDGALTVGGVQGLINVIVAAERHIHLTPVRFLKATASTWIPDSKPYKPEAFATLPLATTGLRASASKPMGKDVCYFVRKAPANGNNGKLFYRGCLTVSDIETSANLELRLAANSSLYAGGADWNSYDTAMQPIVSGAEDFDPRLSMIDPIPGPVGSHRWRPVLLLVPAGVTVNASDHAYFDKE